MPDALPNFLFTFSDVLAILQQQPAKQSTTSTDVSHTTTQSKVVSDTTGGSVDEPLTNMRRTIAKRLTHAKVSTCICICVLYVSVLYVSILYVSVLYVVYCMLVYYMLVYCMLVYYMLAYCMLVYCMLCTVC